jgi:hypothetical protein
MPVIKRIGLGCSLSMTPTTASSSYTTIAGLISLPGPNASADDIDTSTIDNTTDGTFWKTFARGQVDPGEMSLTLAYGSTDASSKKLGTALKDGLKRKWKIVLGSTVTGATEIFVGYVKGMGREVSKDAMIIRTVTIKVSGTPAFVST